MLVRFAALCDQCGRRSAEWAQWPSCHDCLLDICPDCAAPGEAGYEDEGRWVGARCRQCVEAEQRDLASGAGGAGEGGDDAS